MSVQREKAGVMQMLLVQIQLALITVHVSQDLMAMELIASVSSSVVLLHISVVQKLLK